MASRAQARGLKLDEFVAVCIEVDDPDWRDLVEHLMPGKEAEWESWRRRGTTPIARGTILKNGFIEPLAEDFPALAADMRTAPPVGCFHVVVLSRGASFTWVRATVAGPTEVPSNSLS